ncbi:MAG TPA: M14 metallopeptidase family protein [Phnomibacter sp.]|nr:M14 metallopeptidase family protein [Phnomibacter sp.]
MMKRLQLIAALLMISLFAKTQKDGLSYYLPDTVQYDANIPTPKQVIGHEPGEWHVTHDKLVMYMKALAAANPQRIKLQVTGTTYEGREQLLLMITAPGNHARLEEIRKQHLDLLNPEKSGSLNTGNMPAVVVMGYSIHGNESSGANAALVVGYYLAAAKGAAIDDLLQNTVILFDPSFNPDGLNRFATWANQHKSKNLVSDPQSREYNEVWPGGRFNHYWFDLNRDWLPAVHRESQNRLRYFHDWKPNILTDHHEMGSNATFFFQPGVPSRVHPLTPVKNQDLTGKIGKYHAAFLDRIGSLYFTKEGYDDFYYGKGSTFPDMQGGIGILFEQASSRGHVQETENGLLTFPFTIRNQFVTTLSTLEAARNLRVELLNYQRDFYKDMARDASASAEKAFVFGDEYDQKKAAVMATMLTMHGVSVYKLNDNIAAGGSQFRKGNAFIVPVQAHQYKLIRTVFDKQLVYTDSLFYDVTSWTMPLAYGVPYSPLNAAQYNANLLGDVVKPGTASKGVIEAGDNLYGYLLDWRSYDAPKALWQLLSKGVKAKVAGNEMTFSINGKERKFPRGTIVIPRQMQEKDFASVAAIVNEVANNCEVVFTPLATGNVLAGSDLGSRYMQKVETPGVAMLVGNGVSATDAGEVWHLLDQRMDMGTTHLDLAQFNRASLDRYNTIIMVSGNYNAINKEKLKEWIEKGGVLIACEDAVEWCANNGFAKLEMKKVASATDSLKNVKYADKEQIDGAQRMAGAIFRAEIDPTHPLTYGYTQPFIDLFKTNNVFIQIPKNPYVTPVKFGSAPLQSGYITRQNYAALKNSASVIAQSMGAGKVILMGDNPNFRAFWLGGSKLFMNAIFFGRNIINEGSGNRGEE